MDERFRPWRSAEIGRGLVLADDVQRTDGRRRAPSSATTLGDPNDLTARQGRARHGRVDAHAFAIAFHDVAFPLVAFLPFRRFLPSRIHGSVSHPHVCFVSQPRILAHPSDGRIRVPHHVTSGGTHPPSFVAWLGTCGSLAIFVCEPGPTWIRKGSMDPRTKDSDPNDPCRSNVGENKQRSMRSVWIPSSRSSVPPTPVRFLYGSRSPSSESTGISPPIVRFSNLDPQSFRSSAPSVHFRPSLPSFPLLFCSDVSVPRTPSNPPPASSFGYDGQRRSSNFQFATHRGGPRCAHVHVARRRSSCTEGLREREDREEEGRKDADGWRRRRVSEKGGNETVRERRTWGTRDVVHARGDGVGGVLIVAWTWKRERIAWNGRVGWR